MTIRVGVLGATGYTALEALKLLLRHQHVTVTAVTSRQEAGKSIAAVHPLFAGQLEIPLMAPDVEALAEQIDVAFCCLPHGASAETVKSLRKHGVRVIDFSADFRLSSLDLYTQWYGVEHPWPEELGKVVYGMPELFKDELHGAELVANPGCYPTSAILPLVPLLRAGAVDSKEIIVDSKSGVSGAGRSPKLGTLYGEVNESLAPYSIGSHRHQPEIVDIIHRTTGTVSDVLFTPHLIPMYRGILSTIYVKRTGVSASDVIGLWGEAYGGSPFIRVVDHVPATRFVSGTNYVDMHVSEHGDRLVIVCAIDNLIKGASGAAVQNLNCMYGWEETCGLL